VVLADANGRYGKDHKHEDAYSQNRKYHERHTLKTKRSLAENTKVTVSIV